QFFNVNETFELSTENFNKQWALDNNFWTRFNGYLLDNSDKYKTFVCRLSKPRESSGRNENVHPEKLHVTWKTPLLIVKLELELHSACYILLELDKKKMNVTKETIINFCTKRISFSNIRPEILTEVHKFPFPLQKLITKDVHAILKRLEERKCTPNLASAECSCRFFNRYMLSCYYVLYEQLCRTNILMPETWGYFQRTFEESGIEVYQTHGIVEVPVIQKSSTEKAAEKSQSKMNELSERTQDYYYRLAEKRIDEVSQFVG
ncbi:28731_t:CDS:2, partial [Gigaspora margarita]